MADEISLDSLLGQSSTTTTSNHVYLDDLFIKLKAMTKMSNGLPSKSADFDFYVNFPEFRSSLDQTGDGILDLLQHLYTLIATADIASPLDLSSLGALTDEDNFEQMSDVLDLLMESVDANIDEAQGVDRTTMKQYVGRKELISSSSSSSSSSLSVPRALEATAGAVLSAPHVSLSIDGMPATSANSIFHQFWEHATSGESTGYTYSIA